MLVTAAPTVQPLIDPSGNVLTKSFQAFTGTEVRLLQEIERLCDRHRLQFQFRCRNCFEYYNLHDGCKGSEESTEYKVVIECRCTRRVGVR